MWSRLFSEQNPEKCDCALLQETLKAASASRLVMGHTIQARRRGSEAADLLISGETPLTFSSFCAADDGD